MEQPTRSKDQNPEETYEISYESEEYRDQGHVTDTYRDPGEFRYIQPIREHGDMHVNMRDVWAEIEQSKTPEGRYALFQQHPKLCDGSDTITREIRLNVINDLIGFCPFCHYSVSVIHERGAYRLMYHSDNGKVVS